MTKTQWYLLDFTLWMGTLFLCQYGINDKGWAILAAMILVDLQKSLLRYIRPT